MHRLAASAAGSSSTLCLPGLPSANDYVLSFTIPNVTSRRNAMNISHHASNTFIRKMTLQAQTAHLASVKTFSSKQVFLESCASLKLIQQEWGRLGLGRRGPPKTRQQRNTMHWKSIGKNDREAASKKLLSEEKKKDPEEKRGGVQKTRGRKAWKSFGLSCKKGHQGRAK